MPQKIAIQSTYVTSKARRSKANVSVPADSQTNTRIQQYSLNYYVPRISAPTISMANSQTVVASGIKSSTIKAWEMKAE